MLKKHRKIKKVCIFVAEYPTMNRKTFLLFVLSAIALSGAAQDSSDFVKGADVSGLPRQEQHGIVFHDRQGKDQKCSGDLLFHQRLFRLMPYAVMPLAKESRKRTA